MAIDRWVLTLSLVAGAFTAPALAQTIGLEEYLDVPKQLSYSGSFELDTGSGDINGIVVRAGSMQRFDGWTSFGPMWVIVNIARGTAVVGSPVSSTYATLDLSEPVVRDFIPDPRLHSDVTVTRDVDRDTIDGHEVAEHVLTGRTIDGIAYTANIHQTDEGAIVQVEGRSEFGYEFGFELEDLSIGPVDASRFRVPDEYTEVPDLQAVVSF